MMRRRVFAQGRSLSLILVGVCLGLLLQVRVYVPAGSKADADYEQAQARAAVEWLEKEQAELKEVIGHLRQQLEHYQQAAASETEMLGDLKDELAVQRARAGVVPLQGSGVAVTLGDSEATDVPPNADLNPYIIHEYDIRDVVSLLWLAGAEAIAINDERVVASTSVYCVGSTIMVNDTRQSPPYVVWAIGNPASLYTATMDPSNLADLRRRVKQNGLKFAVDWCQEVQLPAYKGGFAFEYALAGGS